MASVILTCLREYRSNYYWWLRSYLRDSAIRMISSSGRLLYIPCKIPSSSHRIALCGMVGSLVWSATPASPFTVTLSAASMSAGGKARKNAQFNRWLSWKAWPGVRPRYCHPRRPSSSSRPGANPDGRVIVGFRVCMNVTKLPSNP